MNLERSDIMRPKTGGDVGQRVVHVKATVNRTFVVDSDSDDDAREAAQSLAIQSLVDTFWGKEWDFDMVTGTIEEPSKE